MRLFWCLPVILLIGASPVHSADLKPLDSNPIPSLIVSLHINPPLDFCGEPVPLDIADVHERLEKEMLLTLWNRPQVVLWIKRSRRYLPVIEKMLAEHGLPDDLKYIAIVESALRPHAGSKRGAIGFWQFVDATGRKYGLKIDAEKDERRNVYKSTRAAISYLETLHAALGSWTLTAAAYNMGEQGLLAEMLAQQTRDYYELYLPLETQRYVLRLVSAKLILSHPQRYGFRLTPGDLYPPLQFERIKLDCFQQTPISIVARAAGTRFKVIKDLNPEIRGHYLAAGSHWILIPPGAAAKFNARFAKLVAQWLADKRQRVYVVRQGDNLSTIAERFRVPLPALIIWNRLDLKKHIHPGDRLVIYPGKNEGEKSGPEE